MRAKDRRIAQLRATISEVEPIVALFMCNQGAVILDIREVEEISQGSPKGAMRIQRGFLELSIEDRVPNLEQQILLICASGLRSLFAADDLLRMGYLNVASVAGGFNEWTNGGLPFETPTNMGW
jgi:sulfur-carrier protein adenylyltransferase/sulfurtransferase